MNPDFEPGQTISLEIESFIEWMLFKYELVPLAPPHDIANMIVDHLDEVCCEPTGREAQPVVRRCRVCGCTDDNCSQCVEAIGSFCHWVEVDLCSRCQSVEVEK